MQRFRAGCWWGLAAVLLLICWPVIHFLLGIILGIALMAVSMIFEGMLFVGHLSETLLLLVAAVVLAGALWITRTR